MNLRLIAATTLVCASPVLANALTVVSDGGTYSVSSGSNEFLGFVSTTAGSGGSYRVNLEAGVLPLTFNLDAEIAMTALVASTFSGLEMSWFDTSDDSLISTIPIVGGVVNSLTTDLNAPIAQYLEISWTNSLAGFGFAVAVNPSPGSIVPLPAGALLLGTALGGLGLARRGQRAA